MRMSQLRQTFALMIKRFTETFFTSLPNVLVIAVIFSLPFGAYLIFESFQLLYDKVSVEPQISLFMAMDTNKNDLSHIEARLKVMPGVRTVQFVPREKALQELSQIEGIGDVIDDLSANPLPDAFIIYPKNNSPAAVEKLATEIKSLPKADYVQLDSSWAKRLSVLLTLVRTAVVVCAVLLSFAVIAVIFNTTRLQILTRRKEIEVAQLIGATNAFIFRPFLYLGAVYGAIGSLISCAIVYVILLFLNRPLSELAQLYNSNFQFSLPSLPDLLILVAIASFLGFLAAFLSVSKYLHSVHKP